MTKIDEKNIQAGYVVSDRGRLKVSLEITQDVIDNSLIEVEKPGVYLFYGLWYGKDPFDYRSYGKIDHFRNDMVVLGHINSIELNKGDL